VRLLADVNVNESGTLSLFLRLLLLSMACTTIDLCHGDNFRHYFFLKRRDRSMDIIPNAPMHPFTSPQNKSLQCDDYTKKRNLLDAFINSISS